MTLDVYAGLFAGDLDAVGERLDAAVSALAAGGHADHMRLFDMKRGSRDRDTTLSLR